jgi:hypothetical protein
LTKKLAKTLPPLFSELETADPDPMVMCKFFTPDASWTWYAYEGSPVDAKGYCDTDKETVDFIFFGLVCGLEVDLGYFSLSELERLRGKFGLPVERDLHFQPIRLSEVKKLCGYNR